MVKRGEQKGTQLDGRWFTMKIGDVQYIEAIGVKKGNMGINKKLVME